MGSYETPGQRHFTRDYALAFVDYLDGGDEEAILQRAYELGHRAIAGEQSILGLIDIHYHVMQMVESRANAIVPRQQATRRSEAFLTQVMALFEMTHRQTLEMNQHLRDNERRKAAILDGAFDSIITFDARGRIIEFNPAAEQIFGHRRAQVVGHHLAPLILPSARRVAFQQMLAVSRGQGDGTPGGQRDELLQQVAQRLSGRLRDMDTLARIGGDEFVVVLEDIDGPASAAAVTGEVIRLLKQPFELASGRQANIGTSVGIALFNVGGA